MHIDDVLKERGSRYGEFKDHAEISQLIKFALFEAHGKELRLSADQRESLEMIAHKLARIVNGDPNYLDSWVDIVGYSQLVIDLIKKGDK